MNTYALRRVFCRLRSIVSFIRHGVWRTLTGEMTISWSQTGEDSLLKAFLIDRFEDIAYKGFWVDVGANHPFRWSNTKMYSDRGWRGINVDASPVSIRLFDCARPKDINVAKGVAEQRGMLDYYMFKSDATNTFSKEFADKLVAEGGVLRQVLKVPVVTLEDILDEYLPRGQHIDFLTVDTEGWDISILKSNNWTKYRPDFILIEIHTNGHNCSVLGGEVDSFLSKQGYEFVGQTLCTTLFQRVQ